MTLMQGLACGLPAIGVKARALPEYIQPSHGFLVPPEEPKAIAEKVEYLFKHEALRKQMGQEAHKYLQAFSPASIGKQWVNLYEQVLEEKEKEFAAPPLVVSKTRLWSFTFLKIFMAALLGIIGGIWAFTMANPTSSYAFTKDKMKQERYTLVKEIKQTYKSLIADQD